MSGIFIDVHLSDNVTGEPTIVRHEYPADWDDTLIMGAALWGWDGHRVEKIVECGTGRMIYEATE